VVVVVVVVVEGAAAAAEGVGCNDAAASELRDLRVARLVVDSGGEIDLRMFSPPSIDRGCWDWMF
jgi:hypothetical protein